MSQERESPKMSDAELEKLIKEAQSQPGIADLMAVMRLGNEVEMLAREQHEDVIVTGIASATTEAA